MAYWGEAMAYNHPLWAEQDLDAARKALEKLAATPEARRAKAPTRREKMYLDAVEALYGNGDKPARDRAYEQAMERLHAEFPDDLDAASLYALSILGACEGKRDTAQYMKAAAIVEEVFAKNPDHPGAAHYLIHCYDDPVHAPLGMRAARVYATIAPSATHALHMPSHIFLASGMWPEVVSSNEASWKASVDRADRLKLGPDAHSFHALSWLEYGYLQQGRYADARRTLALMEADAAAGASSGRAKAGFASMRAAYVVETRRWKGDAVALQIPADDAHRDLDLFTTGFAAIESGDRAGARKALAAMSAKPDIGAGGGGGSAHAHGGGAMSYSGGSSADAVLRQLLEARIDFAEGHRDRAIAGAKSAAALEDGLNYEFGPPDVVKPAHELLGEMLLEAGRPADARKEFEAALARYPGRALSLLGLARAASKAGDAAGRERRVRAPRGDLEPRRRRRSGARGGAPRSAGHRGGESLGVSVASQPPADQPEDARDRENETEHRRRRVESRGGRARDRVDQRAGQRARGGRERQPSPGHRGGAGQDRHGLGEDRHGTGNDHRHVSPAVEQGVGARPLLRRDETLEQRPSAPPEAEAEQRGPECPDEREGRSQRDAEERAERDHDEARRDRKHHVRDEQPHPERSRERAEPPQRGSGIGQERHAQGLDEPEEQQHDAHHRGREQQIALHPRGLSRNSSIAAATASGALERREVRQSRRGAGTGTRECLPAKASCAARYSSSFGRA